MQPCLRDAHVCHLFISAALGGSRGLVLLIPLSPPKSENPILLPVICAVYKSSCQRAKREWAVQDAEAKKTARENPSVVVSSRRRGAQSRVCNAGGPRAPPECARGERRRGGNTRRATRGPWGMTGLRAMFPLNVFNVFFFFPSFEIINSCG